jgi:hypothetical protein
MTRGARSAVIGVSVIALLMVAGHIAFVRRDDRQAAAFKFAVNEPAAALKQITQVAEGKGTLAGSGVGVVIPAKESANLGPTQWTISPDGMVRGTASERGLEVLLTPEMRDGKVSWNCKLEPEREFLRGTCSYTGPSNR